MAEEPLPDWLTEMRGQSFNEESASEASMEPSLPPSTPPFTSPEPAPAPPPPPSPPPSPFPEPEESLPSVEETEPERFSQLFADLEPLEPDSDLDMVGDLRDRIILEEEDLDDYSGEGFQLSSPIPGLTPAQCLVIAVLFFADVALCGCMILFMTQRMELPL